MCNIQSSVHQQIFAIMLSEHVKFSWIVEFELCTIEGTCDSRQAGSLVGVFGPRLIAAFRTKANTISTGLYHYWFFVLFELSLEAKVRANNWSFVSHYGNGLSEGPWLFSHKIRYQQCGGLTIHFIFVLERYQLHNELEDCLWDVPTQCFCNYRRRNERFFQTACHIEGIECVQSKDCYNAHVKDHRQQWSLCLHEYEPVSILVDSINYRSKAALMSPR
jgi:hypothetical protein